MVMSVRQDIPTRGAREGLPVADGSSTMYVDAVMHRALRNANQMYRVSVPLLAALVVRIQRRTGAPPSRHCDVLLFTILLLARGARPPPVPFTRSCSMVR